MKKSVHSITKISMIACFILFFFTVGFYQLAGNKAPSTVEENKVLLKRLVEEAYNQRTLGVLDEIMAPDYVMHTNGITYENVGPEGVKINITENLQLYPDFKVTIEDMFGEGDRVALRWIFQGTHTQFGKQVTLAGIYICRFAEGKIAEGWQIYDNLGSS